jgi:hypothetical protein
MAEYCFAGLVVLACGGEFAASFTNWFTGGEESRKKRLEKCSTILLVAALSLELVCLVKTNSLSGQLIGSISDRAGEATTKAEKALSDSNTAITQSGTATSKAESAENASQRAVDKSGRAEASASSAMTLARGARIEADSFEKDINSAKVQSGEAKGLATEAKTLLADAHRLAAEAQQRASEAAAGVSRISTPRSLTNVPELVAALEPFKGTEYVFASVFQDPDSMDLLKALDSALQKAGWTKVKGPGGFPAVNLYGKEDGFAVPIGFNVGVQASVDSSESLTALQSLSIERLPPPVKAAALLTIRLSAQISPQSPENVKLVDVKSGTSTIVRIAVGKKP